MALTLFLSATSNYDFLGWCCVNIGVALVGENGVALNVGEKVASHFAHLQALGNSSLSPTSPSLLCRPVVA